MDQKNWLWRKRSSEKTIIANGEEEKSKEVDLESSLQTLNEKLASMADECSARDKLVETLKQMADDAMADKNRAEEESRRLKDELDSQGLTANQRLTNLNAALKDCMDQLNSLRNDHDKKLHDAVMQKSNDFEIDRKKLEGKLTAANSENSYLTKALLVKDKLIDDLQMIKNRTEAEFEAMMTRLDSTDKENAFLRYEYRTIEKELEVRNEELEYCRQSLEVLDKQQLESVKKIKRLEGDCQRLRVLTRKRQSQQQLAFSTNVKSDFSSSRRKSMPNYTPVDKKIEFLIGQMHDLERENDILKEFLVKKEEEIANCQKVKNLEQSEKFRASEMSLMDDFVEMEKLAIVAFDDRFSASEVSRSLSDSSKEISPTKELIPVSNVPSSDWLQRVVDAILEQHRISKQSVEELFGDVKMALNNFLHPELSKSIPISGYITWKSPGSTPRSNPIQEPVDVNTSLRKIIELVSKFDVDCNVPAFKIHSFEWKTSELNSVLKEFLHNCNDLLIGAIGYEKFIGDSVSILEWIVNNCTTYNDCSTVRDEFKKHLGGDGPGTALELECVQNLMFEMDRTHSILRAEIAGLKDEVNWMKSTENDPAGTLDVVARLRNEVEVLKESGDQMEDLKATNEDLDTQLSVTKAKLNVVEQKLSCVEVELEEKTRCCEELEGTCLELQLQLESMNKSRDENGNQEELLRTGREITKASARLAECEETIMKLGKQLKGLGSSKELSVVDRVLSMTTGKKFNKQRSSLRDQMLSEDSLTFSREMSGGSSVSRTSSRQLSYLEGGDKFVRGKGAKSGALVIVPSKKKSGGGLALLTRLLLRRKKGSGKNGNEMALIAMN